MDYLTAKQLIELDKKKQTLIIYPRKHIVCVNGFKYFKVSGGTIEKYKYMKRTGATI